MSLQETIRTIRNIMEAEEHGARLGFPELMMKLEKIEQRQQDHFQCALLELLGITFLHPVTSYT